MKALRTDDSVHSCECCGKSGLKSTVVVELDSGELAHYGSVCATRNTGKPKTVIQQEIRTESARVRDAARDEFKAHPATIACAARFAERPRHLLGREAVEFVREASALAEGARRVIAAKHGLQVHEVRDH